MHQASNFSENYCHVIRHIFLFFIIISFFYGFSGVTTCFQSVTPSRRSGYWSWTGWVPPVLSMMARLVFFSLEVNLISHHPSSAGMLKRNAAGTLLAVPSWNRTRGLFRRRVSEFEKPSPQSSTRRWNQISSSSVLPPASAEYEGSR